MNKPKREELREEYKGQKAFVVDESLFMSLLNALDAAERKLEEEREERRLVVEADDFRYRDLEAELTKANERIAELEQDAAAYRRMKGRVRAGIDSRAVRGG